MRAFDLVAPMTSAGLAAATMMVMGFVAALFVGAKLLPGQHCRGAPLPDGGCVEYRLNGLVLFLLVHVVVLIGTLAFGWSLTPILTHFWSLLVVANLLAFVLVGWLAVEGRAESERSLSHRVWFGARLNPRLWGVDLKMFAYQPSLIGLSVINLAFAYRQVELYGTVSAQMVLYLGFWWAYLFTHYAKERFMLTTWDVIAERFGFMLVWGDLVYVPFFYSLCGWFLVDHPQSWGPLPLAGLVLLHALGHWIFRSSNWQKDRFKRDPDCRIWGKPAEALDGRLLVSGWWGIGRKINYTGEILVYLSFALCTGLVSFVPYILPLSLVILLTHRAARDDRRCRAKYGALWTRYCQRARFKIFPYLY